MSKQAVYDTVNKASKILIIDDNSVDRMRYKDILYKAQSDYDILEAENIAQACKIIAHHKPDCILLDNYMPDTNGIEYLISNNHSNVKAETAIVMVTSDDNLHTAIESLKFGADDYLIKNEITQDNFIRAINNAIKKNALNQKIASYQKELERSNEELSAFAHTVAHDLKVPIHKMIKFCQMMDKTNDNLLNDEIKQQVQLMSTSSQHIKSLIDNLLVYASTIQSTERKELICLKSLVSDMLVDADTWIYENNATVKISKLPKLNVYPVRMHQIFLNLITNGIKYKHADRDPKINITHAVEGEYLTISFEDNGIGIPKSKINYIFQPFNRLHVANDVSGSGLGLSICQKSINKHEGKIEVISEEDKGSVFKIYLPLES